MANKAVQSEFLLAGVRDTSGNPLASGKVFHYAAGTLTDKTAWTQSDKSVAAAQPFILDAQGRGQLFLDGLYKLVIKDSLDNTIYTFDNVAYVIDGSIIRVSDSVAPGVFLEDLFDGSATAALKPGQMIFRKGADLTAASTLTLGTDGNVFTVNGNTTINAISSLGVGAWIRLVFTGTPTLTNGANLILPGGSNISVTANDVFDFVETAAGVWRLATGSRTISVPQSELGLFRAVDIRNTAFSTITVKAGMLVEVNGIRGRVTADQSIDISNAAHREDVSEASSTVYYIYIIPPALNDDPLVAGTNIKFSSTAPTYNVTKRGWYHPTNTTWRAIGSQFNNSSSNLIQFNQLNEEVLCRVGISGVGSSLLSNGTATTPTAFTTQPSVMTGVMARKFLVNCKTDTQAVAWVADTVKGALIRDGAGVDLMQNRVYVQAALTPSGGQPIADIWVWLERDGENFTYLNGDTGTRFSVNLVGWRMLI